MSSPREIGPAAEDLLVRARRNELSEHERRRLRALLKASKELELLYLAGVELERSSALATGDEARMQRLVEIGRAHAAAAPSKRELSGGLRVRRAEARRSLGRPAPAKAIAIALGLGAVLGAAVSAAFQYGSAHIFRSTPDASVESVAAHDRSGMPVVGARRGPVTASEASGVVPPVAVDSVDAGMSWSDGNTDPAPRRAKEVAMRSPNVGTPKRAPDDDASMLFAQASDARRRGDRETAIRSYERLCARYPDSVEAVDARVSLGKLKLRERAPAEALRLFETYSAGTLSAEALWGQAEASRQMSSPAERAVLERIVREYPDSSYAMAARKRLETTR